MTPLGRHICTLTWGRWGSSSCWSWIFRWCSFCWWWEWLTQFLLFLACWLQDEKIQMLRSIHPPWGKRAGRARAANRYLSSRWRERSNTFFFLIKVWIRQLFLPSDQVKCFSTEFTSDTSEVSTCMDIYIYRLEFHSRPVPDSSVLVIRSCREVRRASLHLHSPCSNLSEHGRVLVLHCPPWKKILFKHEPSGRPVCLNNDEKTTIINKGESSNSRMHELDIN